MNEISNNNSVFELKINSEVTDKFDIAVNNGVITANLKAGFTKSLGDAENTQVIDTTKFAFGRYYKFDIPATVKADVAGGVDIENTASQIVHQYDPTKKSVEKPEKPTEKQFASYFFSSYLCFILQKSHIRSHAARYRFPQRILYIPHSNNP